MNSTNNHTTANSSASTPDIECPTTLRSERAFYEQEELNAALKYAKPRPSFQRTAPPISRIHAARKFVQSMFPLFGWLSRYDMRRDFIGDLVSGCTVAVMHVPQGMGYALLSNVPPIMGLYTAFFPVLVYFLLGTSRHISIGTFAVVSIMVGKSVTMIMETNPSPDTILLSPNNSLEDSANTITSVQPIYTEFEVAMTVTFLIGIIQLIMFTLRLGILSTVLSETLISGFTTGACMHVVSSQVKDLLGVRGPRVGGNFKVIYTFIGIFEEMFAYRFNMTAILISAITISILVVNNDILKPRLAKKSSVPVPIELIAVVGGTCAARLFGLTENYGVRAIGNIPTGFPMPQLPRFELAGALIFDALTIAIVSYTVTVSMALLFAQRENYSINFNQELLAMGAANTVGGFFTCLPVAASLSRSMIQHGVGGRTQLASLISCSILSVVLLWIGPFFEPLPRCVLASVIVVSLKGMIMQVCHLIMFWRLSRLDAFVWLATFLCTVLIDIDVGLAVGIALSLASIFIRGMKPYTCLLGNVPRTDFYLDVSRYKTAEEMPFIKIFHYCGSLNFAARSTFKSELCRRIDLDLGKALRRLMRQSAAAAKLATAASMTTKATKAHHDSDRYDQLDTKCLIIDFSALSYIDPSGCSALKLLVKELNKVGIIVYIAAASCPSYELMKKCDLRETSDGWIKFYPTVHDAVHHALEVVSPISVITEM